MKFEDDEIWCDCGGATEWLNDDLVECLQCGAKHRWHEDTREWEEVW